MKRTNSDYPRREEDDKQYKSLRGADLSPSNSTGSEGVPEITSTRVAAPECTDETPQVQEDAAPQDEQSTQDDDSSITQPIPGSPEVIPCTPEGIPRTQDEVILLANVFM